MKFSLLFRVLLGGCVLPLTALAQFTISGVADKTTYNNTATLTVNTQAGYAYSATLNYQPIATGAAVVVNKPDFYELRVDATNTATTAVTSQYLRFIVNSSERLDTEWGLPPHIPFPVIQSCSSEFVGARLRLLAPAAWPASNLVPVVAWVVDENDHAVRANGKLVLAGVSPQFQIKRGVGSGFVNPGKTFSTVNYQASVGGALTNLIIAIERNTTWTSAAGTLSGATSWSNNSRIQITGGITIPNGSTLTIGEGSIVRINSGVDITNNGTVTINGTTANPVVFLPATTGQPWGGFVMKSANQGVVNATATIFTGSGANQSWFGSGGNPGSHRPEQALFFCQGGQQVTLVDSAAMFLSGQLGHSVGATTIFNCTRFLMQHTTSGGEFTGSAFTVNDSAFIECPDDSVNFVDGDNDALYFVDGTHFFTNSLFGWTKDDGIDSGGSGYGPLTYQSCWFEATFHEGNSLSGYKNTFARDTVYFDCGQGIEDGYNAPTGRVDHCFFSMCEAAIRHGDNYPSIGNYDGRFTGTNCISIYNHRDLFGFNWHNPGGWTNSFDRFFVNNNFVSALDTNYPGNTLWNPAADGWRLGSLGGVGRVGAGFGTRGTSLAQFPDGIPVGLSRFCTNQVQLDYVVDGTDGTHTTGTLTFPAGLTRRFIPAPSNTNAVYRFALQNGVNADVTGGHFYIAPTLAATTPTSTLLVATNASWKYFDKTNDLDTAWRALAYTDTTWSNGVAQLGFGDGDEATVISNNLQYTTYFRRTFNVTDPAAFTNLSLWLLRDDAGVVFLNSNEVLRSSNLPASPSVITNRQLATATGENSIDTATLAATNVVAGANIVAVEIHQQSLASSDISFALSLTGNPAPGRPRLAVVRLADEVVLYSSDNTAAIEEAAIITGPWTTVPGNTPTGFSAVNGQRFYRLRR